MSCRTCSNSKPRVSIAPAASAQNMKASSGAGLWPCRISIGAGGPTYTGRMPAALSESIQHYLREIYKLQTESGEVTVTALARKLNVSDPSASAMVKKLTALSLARHERYRGVELTVAGERVALEVIRHHRLLELYLAETLGLDVDDVHDEADRLEHALSEELEDRIDRAPGEPTAH